MMIPIIISILYTKYCINSVNNVGPYRSLLSPTIEEVIGAEMLFEINIIFLSS